MGPSAQVMPKALQAPCAARAPSKNTKACLNTLPRCHSWRSSNSVRFLMVHNSSHGSQNSSSKVLPRALQISTQSLIVGL